MFSTLLFVATPGAGRSAKSRSTRGLAVAVATLVQVSMGVSETLPTSQRLVLHTCPYTRAPLRISGVSRASLTSSVPELRRSGGSCSRGSTPPGSLCSARWMPAFSCGRRCAAMRCNALQCVAMRCILREKGINYIKFNRSIHCHALGAKGAWRGRDQRMVAKTVDRPVRREA